ALALFPYPQCVAPPPLPCAGGGTAALGRYLAGGRCHLARALPLQERPPLQAAALAAELPLVASQRATSPCSLAAGRPPLQGALAVAGRHLAGGLGRNWLPLTAGLAMGGWPCMGDGRGWLLLLLATFAAKT
ncbi:hypothetical protein BHM03_00061345, partial [Ensete ventricosum]